MRARLIAAVLTAVVVMLAAASAASATLPVTQSRPFQAVCEAQGGTFEVSIDLRDLYCDKEGALFTAFTPAQLAVQRRLCEHAYGAFFGVQGFIRDGVTGTGTFCATST
jgi:hypothetical protein